MALLRRPGPVLLIVNPAARRASRLESRAVEALRESGVGFDVARTERPGHAAELADAAWAAGWGGTAEGRGGGETGEREYTAVFALGGDGTAREIIGALAHREMAVGVLPGGTGNLVARSLGVPMSIRRAVPALLHGNEALIDLGIIDGARPFVFAAGVGVDARMLEETQPALKRRLGIGAYALSGVRAVLRRRPFVADVMVDGKRIVREAVSVIIANFGGVLSELLVLGPGIARDDGLLDLCVFSPGTTRDALRIAWRMHRRDFREDPALSYRVGRSFHINCTPPQSFQADGEVIGTTPFSVHVDPRAATLLLPRLGREGKRRYHMAGGREGGEYGRSSRT